MTSLVPGNPLTIAQLVQRPVLRAYLENVRDWHGFIRFLGLPDRRDNPDVPIDRLFVEPLLTRQYVSPDEDPSGWTDEAETIFDVLQSNRYVMILGDPGTGKSTLLNYLAWLLARPTESMWTERVGGWMLPVPMVLRELPLRGVVDCRGLLDAFLNHAMSEPLRNDGLLDQMLNAGRALIMLDGIDEIGDPDARRNFRRAVLDGFALYPQCRWVLSSRIVGYDDVRFDETQTSQPDPVEQRLEVSKKASVSDIRSFPEHSGVLQTHKISPAFDNNFMDISLRRSIR